MNQSIICSFSPSTEQGQGHDGAPGHVPVDPSPGGHALAPVTALTPDQSQGTVTNAPVAGLAGRGHCPGLAGDLGPGESSFVKLIVIPSPLSLSSLSRDTIYMLTDSSCPT